MIWIIVSVTSMYAFIFSMIKVLLIVYSFPEAFLGTPALYISIEHLLFFFVIIYVLCINLILLWWNIFSNPLNSYEIIFLV